MKDLNLLGRDAMATLGVSIDKMLYPEGVNCVATGSYPDPRGVFSMHARHALHALRNAIQPKKINNNIFEKISEKVSILI